MSSAAGRFFSLLPGYLVGVAVAVLGPTACYAALVYNPAWWSGVLAWWRPWGDAALFATLTTVMHEILFFGVNCLTLSFDQLGWFKDYKIPRTPQQAVSPQLLRATLRGATFNGLVVQGPASMLLYLCMQRFGSDIGAPLPSVLHTLLTLAACLLFMEAVFYWTHRMQHLPALYQRFHKKHHEYRGPIGFAVEYATPGDDIISNYSSTFLLPVVLGVHPVVWLLWIGFRLLQTYETHSGYQFPWTLHPEQTRFHDFHHSKNVGAFGASLFWDRVCGTSEAYDKHVAAFPTLRDFQRHVAAASGFGWTFTELRARGVLWAHKWTTEVETEQAHPADEED